MPLVRDRFAFLSASVPSGERAERFPAADAREIADAVLAVTRAVFAAGGRLVFGGHPMISPMVLLVAGELPNAQREDVPVLIYQSRVFEDDLRDETLELERMGHGRIVWTPAEPGEKPERCPRSLRRMREQMLSDARPVCGFFVGGMDGVVAEHRLAHDFPAPFPTFAFGAPGGAAATVEPDPSVPAELNDRLHVVARYPALAAEALAIVGAAADG